MKNEQFLQKPLIRLNDIARREKSRNYAKLLLYRLARRGRILRLARGVYSASKDPFVIASNMYYPSYVSFLSASFRHGFTETIPSTIWVAAQKKHKPVEFAGYMIEFALMRHVWGYFREGLENEPVFLAEVEKLMIDAFAKPKSMGSFYEIERVFENCNGADIEKLKAYLKRTGSSKIFRQVGYMLEKFKGIDISSLMPIGRNYHALDAFSHSRKINRKWRLFV